MTFSPTLAVGSSFPPTPDRNSNSNRFSNSNQQIKTTQDPILSLIQRCENNNNLAPIHAAILKSGRAEDPFLLFKLLRLCFRLDAPEYGFVIFENIAKRDVYHYTAFVGGLVDSGCCLEGVRAFAQMIMESVPLDSFVVSEAIRACSLGLALDEGMQVHGQVAKLGVGSRRPVRMRLMEFYGRCGQFEDARRVFGEMPEGDVVAATILISCYATRGLIKEAMGVFDEVVDKDTVCWTAMIDGYVQNGRMHEALGLFRRMQREKVKPNEVTIVCVLSACSQLGALELGRWVHSYIDNQLVKSNTHVGSALIDMYLRCGCVDEAKNVFSDMLKRDVVSYNSMISGFSLNGRSREAVELFHQMVKQGLKPSSVTLVGVLNACSHAGMVDLAFEVFNSMTTNYGIKPRLEHYGCMVDLLGRIGRLEEAYGFIQSMNIEPDHVIWGSLLSACKIHGNLKLGEKIADVLISKEAADSGIYVLLSNAYASFGKWEEAAKLRAQMRNKGIQKEPGCSSIEVGNEIHEFLLGDIRHPRLDEIYRKLEELNNILKLEGYSPKIDEVLQDIEDDQKQLALAIHSERLAICYGLISTKAGTTIRVVKNLRICNDCHAIIKLLSRITKRKIVVRDRNRFHHFEDGCCSCGDYW